MTLDDIYREVLWRTGLTTNDLAYVYSSGGTYSFLQLFGDTYKYLVRWLVETDQNYFLTRSYDSLVSAQQVYYFPTDMLRLRHLEFSYDNANWFAGKNTDPAFFIRGAEQTVVSAATINAPYFWLGDSITGAGVSGSPYHIAPVPTASYTNSILLYYDQMPSGLLVNHISAAVSAASAVPIFPGVHNYLIPLGIAVEVWGKYGQSGAHERDIQKYQKALSDINTFMKPRVAVGQTRVRDFREFNSRDL